MSKWLPAESACALIDQAVGELWEARSEHAAKTIDGYLDTLKEQAREFPDDMKNWRLLYLSYCVGPDNRMIDIEQVERDGPYIASYQDEGQNWISILEPGTDHDCKHFSTVGEAIAAVASILEVGK